MNKKILYSIAIAMMVLLAACSSEENLPETGSETTRTISLTATMPNEPETRVSLVQDPTTRNIEVLWQVDDKIDLAFKPASDDAKLIKNVNIDRISDNGRTAHFTIAIPSSITGDFKLYGAYGGRGMSRKDGDSGMVPIINLPNYPTSATSLNGITGSVQSRKDVVLYFEHDMNSTDPHAKVEFKHLGSLFNITIKNNAPEDITELSPIEIMPHPSSSYIGHRWFYDALNQEYNMVTKNTIFSFALTGTVATPSTFIAKDGGTLTTWFWLPYTEVKWPEIKIFLKWAGANTGVGTVNPKAEKASAPAAGKSYYFYVLWDSAKLHFTDKDWNITP